ncbi:MAG: hypothetical protein ACYTGN_08015 [Planctomycetota bacterium]
MDLQQTFGEWVADEIGSAAVPALKQYLADRGYRMLSYVEHAGDVQFDLYHPDRGFFRAVGNDPRQALAGILRQVWLIDSLHPAPLS